MIHVILWQQVACFHGFAGQAVSDLTKESRANQRQMADLPASHEQTKFSVGKRIPFVITSPSKSRDSGSLRTLPHLRGENFRQTVFPT